MQKLKCCLLITLIVAITAWTTTEITAWRQATATTETTLSWFFVVIVIFTASIAITFGSITAGFAALRTPMLLEWSGPAFVRCEWASIDRFAIWSSYIGCFIAFVAENLNLIQLWKIAHQIPNQLIKPINKSNLCDKIYVPRQIRLLLHHQPNELISLGCFWWWRFDGRIRLLWCHDDW